MISYLTCQHIFTPTYVMNTSHNLLVEYKKSIKIEQLVTNK